MILMHSCGPGPLARIFVEATEHVFCVIFLFLLEYHFSSAFLVESLVWFLPLILVCSETK